VPLFRPIPRRISRSVSLLVLLAWVVTMGVVVTRALVQPRSMNLATDLARYGTAAEWRGIYYRGEKVGFSVSQLNPSGDGFELQEDARLQMSLLGATTAAAIRTSARLDAAFALQSFDFSLDPGTGPVQVAGVVSGTHVSLTITTPSGTQREERDLDEAPVLGVNLPRRLAALGLEPGARHRVLIFDPATLRNETAAIEVGRREIVNVFAPDIVRVRGREYRTRTNRPIPAFRVDMTFAGITTASWITDTGEVVREESPLGLLSVREAPDEARRLAIGGRIQGDLLESAAVVPRRSTKNRIDDPRDVLRMRVRMKGADLTGADMRGAGQDVIGDLVETRDPRSLKPGPADPSIARYLRPEPLIESDDPQIHAEAVSAIAGATDPRARAERLTRAVNAMLDKKPTVSLPSAREVLRTKVGDCNEHTALYVAMARSIGLPSRIAVGLAYSRGAFYYHAWPEVYIDEGRAGGPPRARGSESRGLWLPVDPTFNEFPADAAHVRLMRGGLDRQAAIVPLIGRLEMEIVELDLAPGSTPVLIGRTAAEGAPLPLPVPVRTGMTCWSSPARAR
jgi:transglutaminase-like putative cysteine protease